MSDSNWSEISKDISDISKKLKEKFDGDELTKDLKESFKSTIETSLETVNSLVEIVESSIKDPEIKEETKDIITKISGEMKNSVNNMKSVIKDSIEINLFDQEEE